MKREWKQIMINTIRACQYYEPGELEKMTASEVQIIYDELLDRWLEA